MKLLLQNLGCEVPFGAQVVSSASGDLMDEFELTKPVGWKPDMAGQLHTLALFHR